MASEYETYDCDYFSVEYPLDWNVEKSVNIAYEGWTYQFGDKVSVIAGDDYNVLICMLPTILLEEGSVLDEQKRRFIETLNFTQGSSSGYSSLVYSPRTYDGMFFSVEYPREWGDMEPEEDSIFDTLTYSTYKFNEAYVSVIISEDNVVGFKVTTPQKGHIARDPVGHIIDTLVFKF